MRTRLKSLSVSGYKSIESLVDFPLSQVNILIGANGAGKSNFISFFRMLSWMMNNPGQLQDFIARYGKASSFLFDGPKQTRDIEAHLIFETESGKNEYKFRLTYAAGDTFVFTDEKYRFSSKKIKSEAKWTTLTPMGHSEAKIVNDDSQAARVIHKLLRQISVYQFHDTSFTSRIRSSWAVNDNKWLKEDAGNLSAFLLRLKNEKPEYYRRIIEYIRIAVPFFADFVLEPIFGRVLLQWSELGSDIIFDASSAADGMLRYIALVSLLAQPVEQLPDILIIDEPELGLHPYAINIIAGLIKAVARHIQVIIATQSPLLIDNFAPADIIVLNRNGRKSEFSRVDESELKEWLDSYTISELWEKNVFGGRPSK